jgi:hypothetical protein
MKALYYFAYTEYGFSMHTDSVYILSCNSSAAVAAIKDFIIVLHHHGIDVALLHSAAQTSSLGFCSLPFW